VDIEEARGHHVADGLVAQRPVVGEFEGAQRVRDGFQGVANRVRKVVHGVHLFAGALLCASGRGQGLAGSCLGSACRSWHEGLPLFELSRLHLLG